MSSLSGAQDSFQQAFPLPEQEQAQERVQEQERVHEQEQEQEQEQEEGHTVLRQSLLQRPEPDQAGCSDEVP